MKIELLACVLLFIVAVSSQETQPNPQQKCDPGKTFKKDCNTCRCALDGSEYACTRKSCPGIHTPEPISNNERRKREVDERCEPHSSFKKDCNTCKCNAEGTRAVCTYIRCPSKPKSKRDQVCAPNSTFQKDCNTCTCNSEGTNARCTLKACLGNIRNRRGTLGV